MEPVAAEVLVEGIEPDLKQGVDAAKSMASAAVGLGVIFIGETHSSAAASVDQTPLSPFSR